MLHMIWKADDYTAARISYDVKNSRLLVNI